MNNTADTRNLRKLDVETGNLYQSIAIISKRANQISAKLKEEINDKLQDFVTASDSLEEVLENREQIELSKTYERMPKPSLLALQEFMEGKVYFRMPEEEAENTQPDERD